MEQGWGQTIGHLWWRDMIERYHLERPASLEYLPELREFVASSCRRHGIEEDTRFALQLCADEAATNIIMHG